MSKLIRISLGVALGLGFSAGSAYATCGAVKYQPINPCHGCKTPVTGTSTLPPLSSYFDHEAKCKGKTYTPKVVTRHHAGSGQTAIVQNSHGGAGAQTAIVQNSGIGSAPQTAIVQNSGLTSGAQTAIVQNSGAAAPQTAIVQNSGVSSPQTAIVQNSGVSAPQTAIVQNSGTTTAKTSIVQNSCGTGSQTAIVQNNHIVNNCSVTIHRPPKVHHRRVVHPPKIIYPPAPRPTYYRCIHPVSPVPYPGPVCVNNICQPRPHPQPRRSRYGW